MKSASEPVGGSPSTTVRLVKPDGPSAAGPPGRRRPPGWLLGVLAGAAVAAVGTFLDYGLKARLPSAPAVMLFPLDDQPVTGIIRTTGRLVPREARVLSQPIAGQIAEVRVKVGDAVTADQILARFDSLALKAEQARADARLVAAEAAAFEAEVRLTRLVERASEDPKADQTDAEHVQEIATARLATAKAEVNAREASYRLATHQAGQGTVRAPGKGVVTARNVEPGQIVPAGASLFEIAAEPDRLMLVAQVPEAAMARVAVGLPARFSVPAHPGRTFRGTVSSVSALAGPEGARGVPIAMTVDGPERTLTAGMSASAEIASAAFAGGLRAPATALTFVPRGMTRAADEQAVWVSEGQALRRIPVELGASDGGFVELRSPALRPGANVAVGYARPVTDRTQAAK